MKRAWKVIFVAAYLSIAAIPLAANAAGQEKVTLCHAAGLDGTTHYVTITVGYPAAYGPAGHFYENGTPRAGHEQDYLGECEVDTSPTPTPSPSPSPSPSPDPSPTDEPRPPCEERRDPDKCDGPDKPKVINPKDPGDLAYTGMDDWAGPAAGLLLVVGTAMAYMARRKTI